MIATYVSTASMLDPLGSPYTYRFARWHALGLRFVERRECPRVVRYPARGGTHVLIRSVTPLTERRTPHPVALALGVP